ncbi:MAG: hypothetical protein PWQ87_59 [Candidatus Woesearchaeota archaeon]|nr:hypothetical protein [Candidatus Woesearchaeota archaeon]
MVKLNIIEKKEEPLFERVRYKMEAEVGNSPTPSRAQLRDEAIKLLKIPKDNYFIIDKINRKTGDSKITFSLKSYSSEEAMKRVELPGIIKRNLKVLSNGEETTKEEKSN